MNEKSAKLCLVKDTSFSLTTVSSSLNIITDLTQHADFTFNYSIHPPLSIILLLKIENIMRICSCSCHIAEFL